MKKTLASAGKACLTGLLIIIPIYLATLLLLKGMKSVVGLVKPFALLLPDWLPAEKLLSLLLVLLFVSSLESRCEPVPEKRCGNNLRNRFSKEFLVMHFSEEDALVPAFIIEEFDDGRYTVFVPSIPTPLAGAVYILDRRRVHPLDVAFTDALRVESKWGSGTKDLALAMEANRVIK